MKSVINVCRVKTTVGAARGACLLQLLEGRTLRHRSVQCLHPIVPNPVVVKADNCMTQRRGGLGPNHSTPHQNAAIRMNYTQP